MNDSVNKGFPCWEVTQQERQEAIGMSPAERPPLQLFAVTSTEATQNDRKEGGNGDVAAKNAAQEETEVFTGYFGLSFSDALMQKLQICFLTKSPVAVTKQDWAPASAFALLLCIFPLRVLFKV